MASRPAIGPTGRSLLVLFVCLLTVTLTAACGRKEFEIKNQLPVFPVKGKVTLDGQPIKDAMIFLYPVHEIPKGAAQQQPFAKTDADGNFQLSTYANLDGAPTGNYRVSISWKGPLEGVTFEQQADLPEKLPERFQNPRTSRLRVKIEEGENEIPEWKLSGSQNQASNVR